jgi:integrase
MSGYSPWPFLATPPRRPAWSAPSLATGQRERRRRSRSLSGSFAYVAATLDFFCGLGACEIRALQWKHVSFDERRLSVRRSKTPADWRDPSLNDTCLEALRELQAHATAFGFTNPEHFLFLWHGRNKKLDPARPMTSWRRAWRSLRLAAGLPHRRFHDGRHTALTSARREGRARLGERDPLKNARIRLIRKERRCTGRCCPWPRAGSSPCGAPEVDSGAATIRGCRR